MRLRLCWATFLWSCVCLPTALAADPLSTSPDWSDFGSALNAEFGFAVSIGCDVNGDGFDDVIVGAYKHGELTSNVGRVYVYYGSGAGLPADPSWTAQSNNSVSEFGQAIACAGDVNNDGYDDIIVGDPDWEIDDDPVTADGAAFVYYGSTTGLDPGSPNARPVGNPSNADWAVISDQVGANLGQSVATAGDVNNDGYSDIIIGADEMNAGELDEGRVFVFHGSMDGLELTPAWTAESDLPNADFGFSVNTAGDVNNDGYSDVIVGSHRYDDIEDIEGIEADEGWAFVYHGSASGLPDADADGRARPTDANWFAQGNDLDARFGWSVAPAGDVNADGYHDVLVGAYRFGVGPSDVTRDGAAFVFLGSDTGLQPTPHWTVEADQPGANYGWSVSGAGDVNRDGYGDVLVGARDHSDPEFEEGRAFLYLGSAAGLCTTSAWAVDSGQAGAHLANSVSGGGDLNGDLFDDVVLGADEFDVTLDGEEGGAFAYHSCAVAPPTESPELDVTHTQLSWTAVGGAGYDVVRGDLLALLSTADLAQATEVCLANDTPAQSLAESATPTVGQAWWYLVRAVSCGGGGTLDTGSASQVASRDVAIGGCTVCP